MPTLNFRGRAFIERHHENLPYYALVPDAGLSVLPDGVAPSLSGNLLIEGDNMLALQSLLPHFQGKVKCIYVDPPYNTGNEHWVYNDNVSGAIFKEWLGQEVGPQGEDFNRHDKWCCMMYPRLMLLRELLREDGVIFVSIDDNEVHHLRMLIDEIFGEDNFLASLVWEKGRKNDAKLVSVGHEYILLFAKSKELLKVNGTVWREQKPGALEIIARWKEARSEAKGGFETIEADLQEWFRSLPKTHPSKKLSRYKNVDGYGPWRDGDISWPGGGGPRYDVIHPVTKQPCKVPERGWIFSTPETMQKHIDRKLVVFREDHSAPPLRKRHLMVVPEEYEGVPEEEFEEEDAEEENPAENDADDLGIGLQVMPSVLYKQSQSSVKYLRKIMGKKVFNNPKDHEVIAKILRLHASGDDIILDSFAGSGTTAHAVLQLNAEDGGNRRFITVQMPYDSKGDERTGRNIARDITRERIKRVIEGVGEKVPALGGSFTYCALSDEPLKGYYGVLRSGAPWHELAGYVWQTETLSAFDATNADPETGFVGRVGDTALYLLYSPDPDASRALDLDMLALLESDPAKAITAYTEKLWLDPEEKAAWQKNHQKNISERLLPAQLR